MNNLQRVITTLAVSVPLAVTGGVAMAAPTLQTVSVSDNKAPASNYKAPTASVALASPFDPGVRWWSSRQSNYPAIASHTRDWHQGTKVYPGQRAPWGTHYITVYRGTQACYGGYYVRGKYLESCIGPGTHRTWVAHFWRVKRT